MNKSNKMLNKNISIKVIELLELKNLYPQNNKLFIINGNNLFI